MTRRYRDSRNLALCLSILQAFELGNLKKYRSDFEMFLHESKIEDFIQGEAGKVVVSTIHKAKGREFDEVIMLLNHVSADTNADKRKLYVGMTRAKKELYLFCNNRVLDRFSQKCTRVRTDDQIYERPKEILIQLSHHNVNLGYFKDKRDIVQQIVPGTKLESRNGGLSVVHDGAEVPIVCYSKEFKEKIENMKKQGYRIDRAYVRFVVGWKEKEEDKEYPIILPDLYFTSDVIS